ncbi:hypothetical protein B0H14DRAFT_3526821 [Mycena olivaceomarginata]|nr:hypothetical protein B0H14DRAFT_3526821 [Mycena olivaceomarginata]
MDGNLPPPPVTKELHGFRSSRSMGHAALDQFDRGYQRLEDGKLAEYLENSAEYAKLLHEMEIMRGNIVPSTSIALSRRSE